MLEIKNLNFAYNKNEPTLKNISFRAKKGEMTVILGANGVGKSTLFSLILGNLKPSSGDILAQDISILKISPKKRAKLVSFVPQEWNSPFNYKTLDIVLMGLISQKSIFENPSKSDILRANELFELLEIKHLINSNILELSGGERQMILLCRALISKAPIMILDEVTSHLDLKNQMKILSILEYLSKDMVIILSLHDANLVSLYANYIVTLKNGAIFKQGKKHEIIDKDILESLYETPVEMSLCGESYMIRGEKLNYKDKFENSSDFMG